jgi:hypothetical protein
MKSVNRTWSKFKIEAKMLKAFAPQNAVIPMPSAKVVSYVELHPYQPDPEVKRNVTFVPSKCFELLKQSKIVRKRALGMCQHRSIKI